MADLTVSATKGTVVLVSPSARTKHGPFHRFSDHSTWYYYFKRK